MRKLLQSVSPRQGLWLWWATSAGVIFLLSLIVRAVVARPPFTDWAYIVVYSLSFPALLIGLLRLVAAIQKH